MIVNAAITVKKRRLLVCDICVQAPPYSIFLLLVVATI